MEKRIYFRNLNALRFFAAAAVIFHHIEQYKFWAGIPSAWGNPFIDALGQKAVSFFFVLSGFLISYLLLEENRNESRISIKNFYIRRVLRIWPVYYLVVILCVFVMPSVYDLSFLGIEIHDSKYFVRIILLFLVLPNLLRVYSPNIVGGNQLWSIGVEEQFYLVWPVLVRSFIQKFATFLLIFIAVKFLVTLVLAGLVSVQPNLITSAIFRFWVLLKIEQMAIGALGAWALFHSRVTIISVAFHTVTVTLSLIAFVFLMIFPVHHWSINYFEGIIFLVLILNLSSNPSIKISLEHPWLNRLGNISYGIYMYHTLCITVCLSTLNQIKVYEENSLMFNVLLTVCSVVLTITVAFLSYKYFEKPFLRMKERFMVVKSGSRPDDGKPQILSS